MINKILVGLIMISSVTLCGNKQSVSYPETKIASWYGKFFNGRTTASGYVYSENDMTCASMDYKFGTVLKVTNLRNKKSVNVVVTDTGSFEKKYGRNIDLSKAAFKKLDKIGYGLLDVKIEVVDTSKVFRYKHGNKKFDREHYGV